MNKRDLNFCWNSIRSYGEYKYKLVFLIILISYICIFEDMQLMLIYNYQLVLTVAEGC